MISLLASHNDLGQIPYLKIRVLIETFWLLCLFRKELYLEKMEKCETEDSRDELKQKIKCSDNDVFKVKWVNITVFSCGSSSGSKPTNLIHPINLFITVTLIFPYLILTKQFILNSVIIDNIRKLDFILDGVWVDLWMRSKVVDFRKRNRSLCMQFQSTVEPAYLH